MATASKRRLRGRAPITSPKKAPAPAGIPAVAYLRRSTDKQEASIADQRTAVAEYAAAHGYRILREYVDDGISGDDTTRRFDFQRLREDTARGDFQAVLCWDQDRFGRFDSLEAGYWIHPFRLAKVSLVTVGDGRVNWEDFTGRVMYSLKQEGKHQFLRDLSRNVTRGQLEAAKAGSWIGTPPFAYVLEGERKHKRLALGPLESQRIVQRIFRQFVDEGRSLSSIADKLNAEGIPTPGGRDKPWRFDVVKGILENPAYVGDFVAGRYSYGKYHTIRDGKVSAAAGRQRKPEAEWIVFRNHHPALIERETFAKAQAILARNKTGRRPHTPDSNPYLLNGKLACGHCGSPLWGEDPKRLSYECSRAKYHGDCPGCRVKESEVLRCIADHIEQQFFALDGYKLADLAARGELKKSSDLPHALAAIKRLVTPPKQPATDRQRLTKQHKHTEAELAKARRNLVLLDPENIPTAQATIRELEQQRDHLAQAIAHQPTEQDINQQAAETLRSLYWLAIAFDTLAAGPIDPEHLPSGSITLDIPRDFPPILRWLQAIDTIRIHTKREGKKNGTRYRFTGGEIVLSPALATVGPTTGSQNPHLPG